MENHFASARCFAGARSEIAAFTSIWGLLRNGLFREILEILPTTAIPRIWHLGVFRNSPIWQQFMSLLLLVDVMPAQAGIHEYQILCSTESRLL
jgi:hypothetical protein